MPNFTIKEISDRVKANNRASDIINVTINGSTRYKLSMYHRHVYNYRKLRKICVWKVRTLKAIPPNLKLSEVVRCNKQDLHILDCICSYTTCPFITPIRLTALT